MAAHPYVLIPPLLRDAEELGFAVPTGRRTRWEVSLFLSRVTGTVTVTLEVSPTPDEDLFEEVLSFGPLTVAGTTVKRSWGEPPDFTVTDRDLYVRGRAVLSGSGAEAVVELTAAARFFDPAVDAALLTKELRAHDAAERDRLVEAAEREVLDLLVADRGTGEVDAWINAQGCLEAIRAEVADQADHLFRRELLQRRHDAASMKSLRETPLRRPGLGGRLDDYRPALGRGAVAWEGRG